MIFDRKRADKEYKIVIRVLERMRLRDSLYFPLGDFKDQREFDYNGLNKIPDRYWKIEDENDLLKEQLDNQKKQLENITFVINTILDEIEKRYSDK